MDVPILMYHRICEDGVGECSPFMVTRSVFARQLDWLTAHGYRGRTAAELTHGVGALDRAVVLTFDDGYLDNYTTAWPLLRERGFNATVFVVADFRRRFNFWDPTGPSCRVPLMEKRHMREMATAGIHFGSHGDSHRPLVELDDAQVVTELSRSRCVLEDALGAAVDSFAYPYAAVDGRAKALVRRAGYRSAYAVNSGPLEPARDPFEIRRLHVGNNASDVYLFSKVAGVEKALRTHHTALRAYVS